MYMLQWLGKCLGRPHMHHNIDTVYLWGKEWHEGRAVRETQCFVFYASVLIQSFAIRTYS